MTEQEVQPNAVAPEVWAQRRKRLFRLTYDSRTAAIEVFDDNGRRSGTLPLKELWAPLEVVDDSLVIGAQTFTVPDDQLGMALAFARFVNLRGSQTTFQHNQDGDGIDALLYPVEGAQRYQYAVVNVGMFSSAQRMAGVLASAGENGWELVTVYDKASNWLGGMEKGFMLLKRPIPAGATVHQWCVVIRN